MCAMCWALVNSVLSISTFQIIDHITVTHTTFSCRRALCELYSFGPFTDQLPKGSGSLKTTLEQCVKAAIPNWFLVRRAQLLPQVNVSASITISLADIHNIVIHLSSGRTYLALCKVLIIAGSVLLRISVYASVECKID